MAPFLMKLTPDTHPWKIRKLVSLNRHVHIRRAALVHGGQEEQRQLV